MTNIDVDAMRFVVIGVAASIFPTHRRAQIAEDINVVAVCDLREKEGKERAERVNHQNCRELNVDGGFRPPRSFY